MKATAIDIEATATPVPDTDQQSILTQGEFKWHAAAEYGMHFKPGTPKEYWLERMQELCAAYDTTKKIHVRTMFMLGDALNYGETAYGEEFAQAIDDTRKYLQLDMKTVENAAYICKNVPVENRGHVLSLTHFEAVQTLPAADQEKFLQKAEDEGLNTSDLKTLVTRSKLTDEDKQAIATVTDKEIDQLSHADIKRLLKRAKQIAAGETPTEEAIIDLNSDEGLQHALIKAAGRLENIDMGEITVTNAKRWETPILALCRGFSPASRDTFALELMRLALAHIHASEQETPGKDWPQDRKDKFSPLLQEFYKAARRIAIQTHGKK